MTYLKLKPRPGTLSVPGAFLDVEFRGEKLWAACCFISFELADLSGSYYHAVDDKGDTYEVLIPKFEGLLEGVTVIKGMYEAGVETEVRRV